MKIRATVMALLLSGVLCLAHEKVSKQELEHPITQPIYTEALIDTYTFDLSSQQTIRDIYKAMYRNNAIAVSNLDMIKKDDALIKNAYKKIDNLEKRISKLEQQLKQAKK
ncbi:hypothetical protein [Helicobacter pylori]|uniref:hypothetical protein n=1 Tax=Helicobacter pylori TaxID=210 RepID=UPI000174CB90|nr:hypothetical protein [Helicobacter pylori]ACD48977.1 hypothetical protein HPSH_07960 [Helicobacter pylori Shi470]QQX48850.1 hypothetical protein HG563_07390 [Helicobacter pylori]